MIEKVVLGETILVMTVADLKNRLTQLPDDLELSDMEFDPEWDCTYYYGLVGVGDNGMICRKMTGSRSYWEEMGQ